MTTNQLAGGVLCITAAGLTGFVLAPIGWVVPILGASVVSVVLFPLAADHQHHRKS